MFIGPPDDCADADLIFEIDDLNERRAIVDSSDVIYVDELVPVFEPSQHLMRACQSLAKRAIRALRPKHEPATRIIGFAITSRRPD